MINIYVDTNTLQFLLNSGQYYDFRARAAALGYNLRTTDAVIAELAGGDPTPAVADFLRNPRNNIDQVPNPTLPPGTRVGQNGENLGELTLAERARLDIQNGIDAQVLTNEISAIRSLRNPTGFGGTNYIDLPYTSVGELPGFNQNAGALRPVPAFNDTIYANDPGAHADFRDRFIGGNVRRNPATGIIEPALGDLGFRDNANLGVEGYTRPGSRFGSPIETRNTPRGSGPPSGNGWTSDADARARNPGISDLQDANAQRVRDAIQDIRNNPLSYDADGRLSPAASAALRQVYAGGVAVGVALGLKDAFDTGNEIADLIRQGNTQGAQDEFAGLIGRLFGGLWGAELGAGIALAFGITNPIGLLAAALLFGYFGTELGDLFLRNVSTWLGDLFGSRFFDIDPLVLDLDLGGVSLTSLSASNAFFDLNNNGFAERTGWVSAGDGLLALDGNRNGRIDNGNELFGSTTQNGFTALARYDENKDGRITSDDSIWNSLLIWRDANGDGVSTAAELTPIAANDIGSIGLTNRVPGGFSPTRAGNRLLAVGSYTGTTGVGAEAIAVGFTTDQSNTRFILPDGFEYDPEVFGLPNLRGYGSLPDLWVAMSLDPVLKAMVLDLLVSYTKRNSCFVQAQAANDNDEFENKWGMLR
jgi:hypothetical protein